MRKPALLFLVLVSLPIAAATRLPGTVVPDHYAVTVAPDLKAESFSGSETIDVEVLEPVQSVVLHAVDLTLAKVTVTAGGRKLEAKPVVDAANETVALDLGETIPAGRATIRLDFAGRLSHGLRGLYLSRSATRKYAVTQFEATSARRAFPCFDEPAMKATFDITLVVDSPDTAISNGAVVSDSPAGAGKHAIRFATTKRLPTYLVAMLVGDFKCISGSAEGVPIRVCSTPGLQQLGSFALEAAKTSVTFFNHYYGIAYPFGKLDLVAIPDFAAGAMENAAAITFRETDLLVDARTASVVVQKRVAQVVAHEVAHQWFGDLVTMRWWNDLWLNEGFATFMAEKPIAAWKPEWQMSLDKPAATVNAMAIDAQLATRPIRIPPAAAEGGGFGDAGIVYDKTAAVLRMVEAWLGPDAFRDAIRTYLKRYSWSNAAAEDFWGTMKEASSLPVDTVLQSFIDNSGVPLLHVSESCDASGRRVTVSQDRLLPVRDTGSQLWSIPICARFAGAPAAEPCRVISRSKDSLTFVAPAEPARKAGSAQASGGSAAPPPRRERTPMPGQQPAGAGAGNVRTDEPRFCRTPLLLDGAGSGYFAVDYPAEDRSAIRAGMRFLTPEDRIAVTGNEWLLVKTNHRDVAEYLHLLRQIPRGRSRGGEAVARPLVTLVTDSLVTLDQRLVRDSNRAAWQIFVRNVLRGYAQPTWSAPAGETVEARLARGAVLWAMGYSGDPGVLEGARRIAAQYMNNPAAVDAGIAGYALRLAAMNGDEAFFNQVTEHWVRAKTPELAARYRNLLPLFRDPKLVARAIGLIYSDRVRAQDLPQAAAELLGETATRDAGWEAAKSHWAELETRSPQATGRIAAATASFCDGGSRRDVELFFTAHPRIPERVTNRALEAIDTCIAFRGAQQRSFDDAIADRSDDFLRQQASYR